MTAFDIINETIEYYGQDVSRRSVQKSNCYFLNINTGNRCAVGRCLLDSAILPPMDCMQDIGTLLLLNKCTLDEILQEKYRGHPTSFWKDLQELHDMDSHWFRNGLTECGESFVSGMLISYYN